MVWLMNSPAAATAIAAPDIALIVDRLRSMRVPLVEQVP
jgi:hypothetical protein